MSTFQNAGELQETDEFVELTEKWIGASTTQFSK